MKSVLVIGLGRFGRSPAGSLKRLAVEKDEERADAVAGFIKRADCRRYQGRVYGIIGGSAILDLCVAAIGDIKALLTTVRLKDLGGSSSCPPAGTIS